MALCYVAVACNGTRDNIYGVYPTWQEAFDCLKRVWSYDEDALKAATLDELGYDAQIIEISDGGEGLDVEIHGGWG